MHFALDPSLLFVYLFVPSLNLAHQFCELFLFLRLGPFESHLTNVDIIANKIIFNHHQLSEFWKIVL